MFESAILVILSITAIALAVFTIVNIFIPDIRGLRKDPMMPQRSRGDR